MALQTVQSENIQQITIRPRVTFANQFGETVHQEWQDLDRVLVQFWNSHSIRPEITYEVDKRGNDLRAFAPTLLPELTRRGLVNLVGVQRRYMLDPQAEEWRLVAFG
jgi:hypothetical protein